jgi:hypothetical protein
LFLGQAAQRKPLMPAGGAASDAYITLRYIQDIRQKFNQGSVRPPFSGWCPDAYPQHTLGKANDLIWRGAGLQVNHKIAQSGNLN